MSFNEEEKTLKGSTSKISLCNVMFFYILLCYNTHSEIPVFGS